MRQLLQMQTLIQCLYNFWKGGIFVYTILVNDDNTLTTSVRERIMQRSKLVDSLHFLVEPTYKELNIADFTVTLEYVLPISKKYKVETLIKSDELYKERLEYKLPFDTNLTREYGDIEIQLTFTKVDLDEEGKDIQYVRKTSTTSITIVPISAWSDVIPDEALTDLDQKILKTDAQIKELREIQENILVEKADNLVLDNENKELYLTAEGNQIGDKVKLSDLGNEIVQSSDEGLITMMI